MSNVILGGVEQPFSKESSHLLAQLARVPGGADDYVRRGAQMIKEALVVKPIENVQPPVAKTIHVGSDDFWKLEEAGLPDVGRTVFVLVAGGLGERLGFPGPKVKIWTDAAVKKSYLQTYVEYILHCQKLSGRENIPLVIMTSDDTHIDTVKFLEENAYFGAKKEQIHILKQEKVPCFGTIDGRLSVKKEDGVESIEMKPHGHGDIHKLIHQEGLAGQWLKEGFKWVFFFQDTNALSFRALPICLGFSKQNKLAMNFLTITRKDKEPVGCVAKVQIGDDVRTCNVEYNLLNGVEDRVLCQLPGNTNILTIDLAKYEAVLQSSGGNVQEFINPKFNEDKSGLKSSARLECMMQDIAKSFSSEEVGCTVIDRTFCFSTVKNKLDAAVGKESPEAAPTAERDLIRNAIMCLEVAGKKVHGPEFRVEVEEGTPVSIRKGLDVCLNPRVVADPADIVFPTDFVELVKRLPKVVKFQKDKCYVLTKAETETRELPQVTLLAPEESKLDANFVVRGYRL